MSFAERTRTGCATCKARHKKCDETRPFCTNCLRHGTICPGYKKVLKWQTRFDRGQKLTETGTAKRSASSSSIQGAYRLNPQSSVLSDLSPQLQANCMGDETGWLNAQWQSDSVLALHESPPAITTPSTRSTEALFERSFEYQNLAETPPEASMPSPTRSLRTCSADPTVTQKIPQSSNSWPSKDVMSRQPIPIHFISIPNEIPFTASILLNYFFDHICATAYTYDGPKNPFRTVVAARWPHSALIFTAAQSLAAACLARQSPELNSMAILAKQEACKALDVEIKAASSTENNGRRDELLLAVLLLGISTSWQDPSDLGLSYYSVAVAIMKMRARESSYGVHNDTFFEQALTYWWMLLSFVTDPSKRALELPPHLSGGLSHCTVGALPRRSILPHPWAGVSTGAQVLLGRTASQNWALRNAKRRMVDQTSFQWGLDSFAWESIGRELEEQAYNLATRHKVEIMDPMDPDVDTDQFIIIDEAYKSSILILIYRTFPTLLKSNFAAKWIRLNRLLKSPFPANLGCEKTESAPKEQELDSYQQRDILFALALHVLDLLSQVKKSSRMLGLTPHLLIIAAGEIRMHSPQETLSFSETQLNEVCCQFRLSGASLADLRAFVLDFMDELVRYFPFMHLNRFIRPGGFWTPVRMHSGST